MAASLEILLADSHVVAKYIASVALLASESPAAGHTGMWPTLIAINF